MNIDQAFPSKWLRASDLLGREAIVAIDRVAMTELDDDTKPVVYFSGKQKGLVLNKTNGNAIKHLYGPDTDNWTGKHVVLFATTVEFRGDLVDAIRVKGPAGPQQAPVQPPVAPQPENGGGVPEEVLDDSIPF